MTKASRLGFQAVDVHFGTFDYTVHVIVGPHKNVQQYVRWKLEDDAITWDGSHRRGTCFYRVGWVPVVWIPRKPRTPREYGTLSHELLHAVRALLVDWVGMPLTFDTDEVFCHALGHAVTKTLEALR